LRGLQSPWQAAGLRDLCHASEFEELVKPIRESVQIIAQIGKLLRMLRQFLRLLIMSLLCRISDILPHTFQAPVNNLPQL
jgi:hypothetical protein